MLTSCYDISNQFIIFFTFFSLSHSLIRNNKNNNNAILILFIFLSSYSIQMGLPEAFFPEYNMVYRMMRNPREKYDLYQAIPESTLKEIKTVNGSHYVIVQKNNNEELTFEVSFCAILIGSRPNLSFLTNINKDNHQIHHQSSAIIAANNNTCNQNNHQNSNNQMTNVTVNNVNSNISSNNNSESNNISIDLLSENFAVKALRRFKIFCEKCRHLNLCFGNRNRNPLLNSFIDNNNCPQQKNCECEYLMMPANANGERKHNHNSKNNNLSCNENGVGFGENPKKPIDCKNNPIAVNKMTNELLNHAGVYAMGPLVSDNFVRFISGGALAITAHLNAERNAK
jgi:hypothetical protein